MKNLTLALTTAVLFATCTDAYCQEKDPVRAKIDMAKSTYEAETAKLSKEMLDTLQKKDEAARKTGNKELIDRIKEDREAFEKDGDLPTTVPVLTFLQKSRQARHAVESALRQATKEYLKMKLDDQASKAEAELKEFLANTGIDRLRPGEALSMGDSLVSKQAKFELTFQKDGNLVLYRLIPTRMTIWNSGSLGKGAINCYLQRDGNLLLKNRQGGIVWSSGSAWKSRGKLVVQDDGNVVIYDKDGKDVWQSKTGE